MCQWDRTTQENRPLVCSILNKTGYAAVILVVWNAVVFAMYGLDKRKARGGGRRVSEKTLLMAAAFLGGPGALLGMSVFRHKTKHHYYFVGSSLSSE